VSGWFTSNIPEVGIFREYSQIFPKCQDPEITEGVRVELQVWVYPKKISRCPTNCNVERYGCNYLTSLTVFPDPVKYSQIFPDGEYSRGSKFSNWVKPIGFPKTLLCPTWQVYAILALEVLTTEKSCLRCLGNYKQLQPYTPSVFSIHLTHHSPQYHWYWLF